MYISGLEKNSKILKVFIIILLMLIIILINSCNLFFSSPHGRENLDDDAAQITAFTAVPSSDNSVVTMWNWKDPPGWVYDDRITEIQIQHSIFGYPENYIFFAGERFTNNSTWQHEWKDLIPGITHYFSIFALATNGDGDDIRYAPIKAKVKLPGTLKDNILFTIQTYEVDDTGPPYVTPAVLSTTVNGSFVLVLEILLPEDVFIKQATIDTAKLTTTGPVRIFPVVRDWDNSGTDYHTWEQLYDNNQHDYAVDESVSMLIDTAGAANISPIDITDIVRKTAIIGPFEIIFKEEIVPETVTINGMVDFLVIDYYEE